MIDNFYVKRTNGESKRTKGRKRKKEEVRNPKNNNINDNNEG